VVIRRANETQISTTASSTASSSISSVGPTTSTTIPATIGKGLSSSAKVGLGVGLSLGCIVLLAIFLGFWWHRQKSREAGKAGKAETNLYRLSNYGDVNKSHIPGTTPTELEGVELLRAEDRQPSELPASPANEPR
jgi:hypothetical protein